MRRAALLTAVLLCLPNGARAQDGRTSDANVRDDPASRAEANRLFEDGVRLLRDRDWAGALRAFEGSQAIRPTPSVLFNIAGCLRALRRNAEARRTYQRFLVIGSRPDQRDQATHAVEELAAEVASMSVTTNVEGAELLLDGRTVAGLPMDLDVGSDHVLEARREGYRAVQQNVRPAAAGPFTVTLALEAVAAPPPPDLRVTDTSRTAPSPLEAPRPSHPHRTSSGGSAWPWIVAGTVVLLAGAAVGGVILFSGEDVPRQDWNLSPR